MLYQELYLELKVDNFKENKKYFKENVALATQFSYVKQFVLSKSTQYRKLKSEWRQNIYLAKSKIKVSQ